MGEPELGKVDNFEGVAAKRGWPLEGASRVHLVFFQQSATWLPLYALFVLLLLSRDCSQFAEGVGVRVFLELDHDGLRLHEPGTTLSTIETSDLHRSRLGRDVIQQGLVLPNRANIGSINSLVRSLGEKHVVVRSVLERRLSGERVPILLVFEALFPCCGRPTWQVLKPFQRCFRRCYTATLAHQGIPTRALSSEGRRPTFLILSLAINAP